jgi:8-amino-7-oxononanoate synthase
VIDFTSALYLGFRHSSRLLRPWSQLTTGAPADLVEPVSARSVADRLARLQGCEKAVLGPSTLHLFWDLFNMLAKKAVTIYLDGGAYPIARWGVERAAARGVSVHRFAHQDIDALRRLLREGAGSRQPVVVTDGICAACGCKLPIAAYHEAVQRAGGLLVLDDTQALGILGRSPGQGAPYGLGGGGSLRHQNTVGRDVLVVSSLAKGFGAPLAVLSGSPEMIRQFEAGSETRVHSSPPSLAAIHAAERALQLNAEQGNARRNRLAQRVQQFRRSVAMMGFSADGGLFPVQTLDLPPDLDAGWLYESLLARDIRTLLRHGCRNGRPALTFVITARHRPQEIVRAAQSLAIVTNKRLRLQLE